MTEKKDHTEDYYNPTGYYEIEQIVEDISSYRLEPDAINWQLVTENFNPADIADIIHLAENTDAGGDIAAAIGIQYTHDEQDKTAINAKIQKYLEEHIPDDFNPHSGKYIYTFSVYCDDPMYSLLDYLRMTHETNINKDYVIRELQDQIKEKEPKPKPQGRPTSNLFQSAHIECEKQKEMKDFFLARHNTLTIPNCKKNAPEIITVIEMVNKWREEGHFPNKKVSGTALVRFLESIGFLFGVNPSSLSSFFNNNI